MVKGLKNAYLMHFPSLHSWFRCSVCFYLKCSSSHNQRVIQRVKKHFFCQNLFQITYNREAYLFLDVFNILFVLKLKLVQIPRCLIIAQFASKLLVQVLKKQATDAENNDESTKDCFQLTFMHDNVKDLEIVCCNIHEQHSPV